jgi:ribokinase
MIDIISPNETEFERMIGKKIDETNREDKLKEIKEFLLTYRNLQGVLLKLSDKGSAFYYIDKNDSNDEMKEIFKPAFNLTDYGLNLIDSTGAGDCFHGGFSYAISSGASIENAMTLANQTGALAVTKFGAGLSAPTKDDVEKLFGNID